MNRKHLTSLAICFAIATTLEPVFAGDADGDGVPDSSDNCSIHANADQRDTDSDGFGNRCDPDFDQSNLVNFVDLNFMKSVFFGTNPDADLDGSGVVNFVDLNIMKDFFFGPPGPGATGPQVGYAADVQPILLARQCGLCHGGDGVGGHDIADNYGDAFLPANSDECPGLNVGQCVIVRIQNGSMPQGFGCTGDPASDAGNPSCTTQAEQDTIQAWIDGGLQP